MAAHVGSPARKAGEQIEVGILGVTGMVGQQFVSRLARHPWFKATWLAASERSGGKRYRDAAPWKLATPMPADAAERIVQACEPGKGPKVVFSALDASAAGELEPAFAAAGHIVVSNARNYRMDELVPLLIERLARAENPDGALVAFDRAVELEQRHAQLPTLATGLVRVSRAVARPQIPSGANSTKAMKIRPK